MATNQVYTVAYRRKREGKTNYATRMKLLLGHKPRLTVRKSLKHLALQLIDFNPTGDKIVAAAHTKELAKYGWKGNTNNTSAGYLVGLLFAKKLKKKVTCVLDIGQYTSVKGNILYAVAQGAKDGGLDVTVSAEVVPSKDRIRGEHIAKYAKQIKADKERYAKQFSKYIKAGIDPEKLPEHFDQVKAKIGA